MFQSTPPHGGRQIQPKQQVMQLSFQSTPPHGGRLMWANDGYETGGFNPRPRMGGDTGRRHHPLSPPVSIHAPAWGATLKVRFYIDDKEVFQSTPPHGGATVYVPTLHPVRSCFNPRPRMGGDSLRSYPSTRHIVFQSTPPHGGRLNSNTFIKHIKGVSIHAPAWGATVKFRRLRILARSFNPRPRMGGRLERRHVKAIIQSFNPRPRMGGDPECRVGIYQHRGFNPRPRMGGDCVRFALARGY